MYALSPKQLHLASKSAWTMHYHPQTLIQVLHLLPKSKSNLFLSKALIRRWGYPQLVLQIFRNISPAFQPLRENELHIGFREDTNVKVGPQSAQCTAGTQWRLTTNQSSPAESLSAQQDMQMRLTEKSVKLIKHTRYAQQRNTSPETYRRAQPQQTDPLSRWQLDGSHLGSKEKTIKILKSAFKCETSEGKAKFRKAIFKSWGRIWKVHQIMFCLQVFCQWSVCVVFSVLPLGVQYKTIA